MKILIFALNGICFGIPIKNVEFIETFKGEMNMQKMSDMPDYYRGLAVLHGMSIPVYNLDSMFGFAQQEIRYLVIISINGIRLALGIDGDGEIMDIEEKELLPPPVSMGTQHYLKNVAVHRQEQLIFLIDVNRLVK